MDAPGTSNPITNNEREHLARAHHEICTALTVLRSNVELVRIHLRETPRSGAVPGTAVPVYAHLDALEGAVERLHGMAREMKRWHDGIVPIPRGEPTGVAAGSPTPLSSTP